MGLSIKKIVSTGSSCKLEFFGNPLNAWTVHGAIIESDIKQVPGHKLVAGIKEEKTGKITYLFLPENTN